MEAAVIERPRDSPTTSDKHARYRCTQFSFPTLLAVVTLAAVLAGWWADRDRLAERMAGFEREQIILRLAVEEAQVASEQAQSAAQKSASACGARAVRA